MKKRGGQIRINDQIMSTIAGDLVTSTASTATSIHYAGQSQLIADGILHWLKKNASLLIGQKRKRMDRNSSILAVEPPGGLYEGFHRRDKSFRSWKRFLPSVWGPPWTGKNQYPGWVTSCSNCCSILRTSGIPWRKRCRFCRRPFSRKPWRTSHRPWRKLRSRCPSSRPGDRKW